MDTIQLHTTHVCKGLCTHETHGVSPWKGGSENSRDNTARFQNRILTQLLFVQQPTTSRCGASNPHGPHRVSRGGLMQHHGALNFTRTHEQLKWRSVWRMGQRKQAIQLG